MFAQYYQPWRPAYTIANDLSGSNHFFYKIRTHYARKSSSRSRIIEVGPRDGLQNISAHVPTVTKIELIRRLASAGVTDIEATSFVSPKWVPQMSDAGQVMKEIMALGQQHPMRFSVLAPNMKGFEVALAAAAKEIVVFASATEAFSLKNQNCTVQHAIETSRAVVQRAKAHNIRVRGVVSCIFSDPYSGPTDPYDVLSVVKQFFDMGCDEIGLGDTLGVGTPRLTQALLDIILQDVSAAKLTGHFHDTYGQAIANVTKSYEMGLRTLDTSVAGLGGCPYAPGARGNASTEDVVYSLATSGIDTGIDVLKLAEVGGWISRELKIENHSRAGPALLAKERRAPVSPSAQATERSAHRLKPAPPSSLDGSSSRIWATEVEAEGYIVSRAGTAVRITLNRPANGNAMTTEMLESLASFFRTLATDPTIFHVVLAAEGKFFCTGMDLTGDSRDNRTAYHDRIVDLFKAIDSAPQTTIAAIHGPCYGGGVGLGFICDIRLVTSTATWQLSEIKLGVAPAIISKHMAREWGFAFFREAMLSGRTVTADELLRIGKVHKVAHTKAALDSMVDEYLDGLSHAAPRAAAICKELMRLAYKAPDSSVQDEFIRHTFDNMLAPGSEGQYGIRQFQNKVRMVDWQKFWSTKQQELEKLDSIA